MIRKDTIRYVHRIVQSAVLVGELYSLTHDLFLISRLHGCARPKKNVKRDRGEIDDQSANSQNLHQ